MRAVTSLPLLLLLAGAPTQPAPRAIVLVTIDTLRADRVGAYGHPRPTTPFLDRLALQGAVFENAFSSAVHTSPAHASLFTGLHPSQHGVRSNGQGFGEAGPGGFLTLAERLAAAGYDTAAVSAVNFLKPISRGFRRVDAGGEARSYRTADRTVERAIEWLATRTPADRFFLWLHLYDPHLPDRAPSELVREFEFATRDAAQAYAEEVESRRPTLRGAYRSPGALATRHAGYEAEVRFADRELARLFDAMQSRGLLADGLWIVTADHGEGLGDHGYDGHGPLLYDEVMRVPLVIWNAGRFAGARIASLARLVDLLPTLVEWLGLAPGPGAFTLQGRSLLPALRAPGARQPAVFAFAQRRPPGPKLRDYEKGEVFALRDLDFKYIVRTGSRDEMYDLRTDPFETQNLAGRALPVGRVLEQRAREAFAQASREGARSGARPASPESEEELRALGYIQ
jgi:arylsulfatase A-like enzyme